MDILVKIKKEDNLFINRPLYCDLCNNPLNPDNDENSFSFYAVFYQDSEDIYLEKYICDSCLKYYKNKILFDEFNKAPYSFKKAITDNLSEKHHGYIVSGQDFDEFMLYIRNPFLIKLFGEKF